MTLNPITLLVVAGAVLTLLAWIVIAATDHDDNEPEFRPHPELYDQDAA